ncbi:MAG: PDZ domain-containing protein [Planctomycetaceae bacterium]
MMFLVPTFVVAQPTAIRRSGPTAAGTVEQRVTKETRVSSDQTESAKAVNDLADTLGWEISAADTGVRIERIVQNSPVARAHLQEQDQILKVGGENVKTTARITTLLQERRKAGEQQIDIVVIRDGKELSYLLDLDAIDSVSQASETRQVVVTDADLAQMILQLQVQIQKQQEQLNAVLVELQNLRLQVVVTPTAEGPATGTQVRTTTTVPEPRLTPANP